MVQKKKPASAGSEKADEGKRRGRPRAYEPDVAIGKALNLFRRTGYAATSLDDLSTATGMNRPSLYGAFGDKRALYIKSYQRYRDDYTAGAVDIFNADIDIRERLKRFLTLALDIHMAGEAGPSGCFTVMTVASDAIADAEISAMVREGFKDIDDAFVWCFRTAIARGELPDTIDVTVRAQMASAMIYLSAVRSRAGMPRAEIEATLAGAIEQLCRN